MVQQLNPELNDVELKPLFSWFGRHEITDSNGNTFDVYIRLVGDVEINRARVFALRKSAELRKLLKTEGTDERIGLIEGLSPDSKDGFIAGIMFRKAQELYLDAVKEVRVKTPKEPSSADLEAQEKYQLEVDSWQDRYNKALNDWVTPRYEKYMNLLSSKSENDIRQEYESIIIKSVCDNTFQSKFKEMCTFFGTFKDEEMKQPFFESFEEFENLRSDVKKQFIEFYSALDLSNDDLKK